MSMFQERDTIASHVYSVNYTFIDTQKQFDRSFDRMMSLPYWVTDTETTGLSCIHDKVILLQIGNRHEQFLIDVRTVDPSRLRPRFEDEGFRKYLQNAIFDYKMMKGSLGITMEGMRDGELAEKILTCGLQKAGFGMAALCLKYLKVKVNKEMQTSFIGHTGPFSPKQKEYAALDCVYPDHYIRIQARKLVAAGLRTTFELECNALQAFGDAEYYGLLLDKDAWESNIVTEQEGSAQSKADFIRHISPFIDKDMFRLPDINPASPDQVLSRFKNIFPHNLLLDPDNKDDNDKPKVGTGVRVLTRLIDESDHPEIPAALMKFREHEKKVGTYGYTYLNHIDASTGRFHPSFIQIGTETGRPSGRKPNMLNIPRDGRYRAPWIAGPGRKVLTNDYGACELRIMASMSGDPVMCKGFNDGLDYHTYTASQFVKDSNRHIRLFISGGEPGKGKWGDVVLDNAGNKQLNPSYGKLVSYDQVSKEQRTVAKTINFGLAYGMGPGKLANTLKISLDEGRAYISQFNTTFAVLVKWLKRQQEIGYERGWSETYLGRRRYFRKPPKPYKPEWDKLKFDRNNPFDDRMPKPLKKYHSKVAAIKRESGNSPIQGGNADITKIAMYEMRKYVKRYEREHNGGEYLAHVALQVYDELVLDCPEHLAKHFATVMDDVMRKAGERVITQVPVETDCAVADTWVKD